MNRSIAYPPEDIIAIKRERMKHQIHVERINGVAAHVDTGTPASLGMKHLELRLKKQQISEDRAEEVSRENRKLMEKMTHIMQQPRQRHPRVAKRSLNKIVRQREVDRINFENRLMLERLNRVSAGISNQKLASDFKKHLKAKKTLRRKGLRRHGPKRAAETSAQTMDQTLSHQHLGDTYLNDTGYGETLRGGESQVNSSAVLDIRRKLAEDRMENSRTQRSRDNPTPPQMPPREPTVERSGSRVQFEMHHDPASGTA